MSNDESSFDDGTRNPQRGAPTMILFEVRHTICMIVAIAGSAFHPSLTLSYKHRPVWGWICGVICQQDMGKCPPWFLNSGSDRSLFYSFEDWGSYISNMAGQPQQAQGPGQDMSGQAQVMPR